MLKKVAVIQRIHKHTDGTTSRSIFGIYTSKPKLQKALDNLTTYGETILWRYPDGNTPIDVKELWKSDEIFFITHTDEKSGWKFEYTVKMMDLDRIY